MSYQLNEKLCRFEPYAPISGDYKIRLDANESFLSLPPDLLERAVLPVLGTRINRYPDPYAEKVRERFGSLYGVNPDCLVAGNGSDELISIILGTFFAPDELLVGLDPDFSMYRICAEAYGVKFALLPKTEDLAIDADEVISYLRKSGARGLIFSNPCNPTSICLDRKEVLRLIESVPECLFIVDEAYMDFADESVLENVGEYDNLIVLKTCSKAFGLASIRLGFAASNKTVSRALLAVKPPYNVNALTQSIAYTVMGEGDYLAECIEKLIRSRDKLYTGLMAVYAKHNIFEKIYPTAANFVFVKSPYAKQIYEKLLSRSIVVRLMGNYLRISAGSKSENAALLDGLEQIAGELEE